MGFPNNKNKKREILQRFHKQILNLKKDQCLYKAKNHKKFKFVQNKRF